ncbi:MAG TPA: hypothetical protein DCY13_18490 [Verrucomicrobiales bacterium]|nr:hypothetical protein [Verrucomicrobiales bacterium]
MPDNYTWIFAAIGVLFIGLSKAGFGGGLGMLTTPLCALAFGPKEAIGILLPLLCAGDAFSMYFYWSKWDKRNLKFLLPAVAVGVVIGVQMIGLFSKRQFNIVIGALAVTFVLFQLFKHVILKAEGTFRPSHKTGIPFGLAMGVTSTFAHGAGPVGAMYLIPQRLPKELFVGTTILIFFWVNWIKMPFFVVDQSMVNLPLLAPEALINWGTLKTSLLYLPLVPLGVLLGVWLNRRIPEALFLKCVYVLTFLAGVQLILNFDLVGWLR